MSKPEAFFVIRYLKPSESGDGKIHHVFSADKETINLKEYKEENPEVFKEYGFYSLMVATGQTLTVAEDKKKNGKKAR